MWAPVIVCPRFVLAVFRFSYFCSLICSAKWTSSALPSVLFLVLLALASPVPAQNGKEPWKKEKEPWAFQARFGVFFIFLSFVWFRHLYILTFSNNARWLAGRVYCACAISLGIEQFSFHVCKPIWEGSHQDKPRGAHWSRSRWLLQHVPWCASWRCQDTSQEH